MHFRAMWVLSICLLFTLVACSSKPADTASNSASQNTAGASHDAGGSAMNSPAAPAAPPPQAPVVPAGTTPTIRLGESVGSEITSPGQRLSHHLAWPSP